VYYRLVAAAGVDGETRPFPFSVQNWESYALASAGATCQQDEQPEEARTLYARALDLDPRNRLALHNLATLDLRFGASHAEARGRLFRACYRLKAVRRLSTDGKGASRVVRDDKSVVHVKRDGLWCRATHNLALTYLLLHELRVAPFHDDDPPADRRVELAQATLSELVVQIGDVLIGADAIDDEEDPVTYVKTMRPFVLALQPQVVIAAAGLLARRPHVELEGAVVRLMQAQGWEQTPAAPRAAESPASAAR
jgi:hypothetical protein